MYSMVILDIEQYSLGVMFFLFISPFRSYGDVTIAGKELQMYAYALHSLHCAARVCWRATPTVTKLTSVFKVISEDPRHSLQLSSGGSCKFITCFNDLNLSLSGFELHPYRM